MSNSNEFPSNFFTFILFINNQDYARELSFSLRGCVGASRAKTLLAPGRFLLYVYCGN